MDDKRSPYLRPSVLALVIANVVPLVGVLVWDWKVFPLLLLFWMENVIIGVFNALKMISAIPMVKPMWFIKMFIVPFFCFHYGMFTFVHGMFVVLLFGGELRQGVKPPSAEFLATVIQQEHLIWGLIGLAISHGVSFVTNYIGRGEYLRTDPMRLMAQPYGRIMILHVTILLGGGLMLALKSPTVGLLLLVLLKIVLDVRAHLRERQKFSAESEPSGNPNLPVGSING